MHRKIESKSEPKRDDSALTQHRSRSTSPKLFLKNRRLSLNQPSPVKTKQLGERKTSKSASNTPDAAPSESGDLSPLDITRNTSDPSNLKVPVRSHANSDSKLEIDPIKSNDSGNQKKHASAPVSPDEIKVRKNPKGLFEYDILKHRMLVGNAKPKMNYAENVTETYVLPEIVDPLSKAIIKLPTYVFVPKMDETESLPTIFYFPGTAFVSHESQFTKVICSQICALTKSRVIVIYHRLAPENPCPTPFNDSYGVFSKFMEHPKHYGIDVNKIAVMGYSSGGNLAALVALKAQQENININLQLLVSPLTDLARKVDAFQKEQDKDHDISEKFLTHILDLYFTNTEDRANPEFSPLWAIYNKPDKFSNIAPAYILYGEHDRTRGDAELYADALGTQGKLIAKQFLPEQTHALWWHNPAALEIAAKAIVGRFNESLPKQVSHKIHFVSGRKQCQYNDHDVSSNFKMFAIMGTAIGAMVAVVALSKKHP